MGCFSKIRARPWVQEKRFCEGVWGDNYFGDVKIVDVNIRRLRMKIEDEPSSRAYPHGLGLRLPLERLRLQRSRKEGLPCEQHAKRWLRGSLLITLLMVAAAVGIYIYAGSPAITAGHGRR